VLVDADPSTRWLGGLISNDQPPEYAPVAEPTDLPPAEVPAEQAT
jgi:AI-2 transport protein TqsA